MKGRFFPIPGLVVLFLFSSIYLPVHSTERNPSEPTIVNAAHGLFLDQHGKPIEANTESIKDAQRNLIARLLKEATDSSRKKAMLTSASSMEKQIFSLVKDEVLANAFYFEALLQLTRPEQDSSKHNLNNALRWHYVNNIQKNGIKPHNNRWNKGVDVNTAKTLEALGLAGVRQSTTADSSEYIEECREAGVPVPDTLFGPGWVKRGALTTDFLSGNGAESILWSYESKSPRGVCLALPRFNKTGDKTYSDQSDLTGMICLGTQTSTSCFFDNPKGTAFPKDKELDVDELLGGAALATNDQGVCTDCHAGENPFVVHPYDPAFSPITASLRPANWSSPMVDPSWPQNLGPSSLLDTVFSENRCDSCHNAANGTRFPIVYTAAKPEGLAGYCNTVLSQAWSQTMAPGIPGHSSYANHYDALKAACRKPKPGGVTIIDVEFPDDPGFISPPIVVGDLFQCASKVSVKGVLNATTRLFLNGVFVESKVILDPNFTEFIVPELKEGDELKATQEVGVISSGFSDTVVVLNHKDVYPGGLPAPEIDPTVIYECASVIAVRHVPGATIKVTTDDGKSVSKISSRDWTAIAPNLNPFKVGDSFVAEISLCDDTSPPSNKENALAAPSEINPPFISPTFISEDQELIDVKEIINGATVSIYEDSFGHVGDFQTPVSWKNNYNLKEKMGASLSGYSTPSATQKLCKESDPSRVPTPLPCDQLPAPVIAQPQVGDNTVTVVSAVPGARIKVYDDASIEIGDSGGNLIALSRNLINGDVLTVVQQVGKCTSNNGYQVEITGEPND